MADIDIAAMDAATKLAYAQAVGSVLLTKGAVASPVASLIFSIPSGYQRLRGEMTGLTFDTETSVAFAFSPDDGVTWLQDTDDYNGYHWFGTYNSHTDNNTTNDLFSGFGSADSLAVMDDFAPANITRHISFELFPGAVGDYAWIEASVKWLENTNVDPLQWIWHDRTSVFRNRLATGVQNKLMILPYGNGDAPPSGAATITAGTYSIVGHV